MIPAPGTYTIRTDHMTLVLTDLAGPPPPKYKPLPRRFPYQSFRFPMSKAEQRRRKLFYHLPRRLRP